MFQTKREKEKDARHISTELQQERE